MECKPADMGKPKFTPALGISICDLVAAGVTIEAAAGSRGVCKRSVYNWRRAYPAFDEALDLALARSETMLTQHVTKRAKDDWRAGAWWLERRRPEVYGETSRVTHLVDKGLDEVLNAAQRTLDPDSYQRLLAALAPERAGKG